MSKSKRNHTFAVIGLGRLGQSLSRELSRAGFDLTAVVSRRGTVATQLARELSTNATGLGVVGTLADVLFLTVPDTQIAAVAGQLRVNAHQVVVHCSGACELAALDRIRSGGASRACFHPLQAFPEGAGDGRFLGIHVGIEADSEEAFALLSAVARALGAQPLSLLGVDRARYHAAAALASNALVALMGVATEVWREAGLSADDAWPALQSLAQGALSAVVGRPLVEGLTGPVARGDVDTVRRHLEALAFQPLWLQLYAALGEQLVRMGRPVDPEQRLALRALWASCLHTVAGREPA